MGYLYQNEHSFNSAAVGLDVGWELDIWGKYARGIESAEASLYASIASYRDVLVTVSACLLYTSDAADERSSVDLGGRRIIKKKKKTKNR